MLRKFITFAAAAAVCFTLSACNPLSLITTPSIDPSFTGIEYSYEYYKKEKEWVLKKDDKIFVPYCNASPAWCGNPIGTYMSETIVGLGEQKEEKIYVFELIGSSPDAWLVDAFDDGSGHVSGHNIGFLYKEISVTEIPALVKTESESGE